ncbi:MAG: zf-HC2 domain-containing protein [Acidothermus sp.]|nr:zf-HC2 domain-containing protein [Acidothermus sp.]
MGHLGETATAFVDDELSEAERRQALAHLEACPRCRAEVAQLRLLKSEIGAASSPLPPPLHLCSRLRDGVGRRAVAELVRERRHSLRGRRIVAVAAGLAVMAGCLAALGSETFEGSDRAERAVRPTVGPSVTLQYWLERISAADLHVKLAQGVVYRRP